MQRYSRIQSLRRECRAGRSGAAWDPDEISSTAASEYLYQGAHTLQNGGVTNPTVLDVRGFYNFGPQNGVALATAPADQPMSATLAGISSATLAANGITPGETVGQWRTAVSAKIGNTAGQPVSELIGGKTWVSLDSFSLSPRSSRFRGSPPHKACMSFGPLPGYACMMLNLTEQQYMDGSVRVPSSAGAPASDGARHRLCCDDCWPSRAPEHIVNGFAEALFPTGQTVWIAANMLRPYHNLSDPTMKCAPAKLSNGRPGFSYTH